MHTRPPTKMMRCGCGSVDQANGPEIAFQLFFPVRRERDHRRPRRPAGHAHQIHPILQRGDRERALRPRAPDPLLGGAADRIHRLPGGPGLLEVSPVDEGGVFLHPEVARALVEERVGAAHVGLLLVIGAVEEPLRFHRVAHDDILSHRLADLIAVGLRLGVFDAADVLVLVHEFADQLGREGIAGRPRVEEGDAEVHVGAKILEEGLRETFLWQKSLYQTK